MASAASAESIDFPCIKPFCLLHLRPRHGGRAEIALTPPRSKGWRHCIFDLEPALWLTLIPTAISSLDTRSASCLRKMPRLWLSTWKAAPSARLRSKCWSTLRIRSSRSSAAPLRRRKFQIWGRRALAGPWRELDQLAREESLARRGPRDRRSLPRAGACSCRDTDLGRAVCSGPGRGRSDDGRRGAGVSRHAPR